MFWLQKFFEKFDYLLLTVGLESMTDVFICPRTECQYPTVIDTNSDLGHCPQCFLAFCIYCRTAYHGVSPCRFEEKHLILKKYLTGTEEDKLQMERKFGKKHLRNLSDNLASKEYLAENTKKCPQCNSPVEKNGGCQKIICWRCNTNFCWKCTKKLSSSDPYEHFREGGGCFGLLFEGVDNVDDEEWLDDFLEEDADLQ